MSSSKRARRKKRLSASRRKGASAGQVPRPIRLIADSHDRLVEYVLASEDPASAAALALSTLHESVATIVTLMAGHDSLDIVEAIALTNLIHDPETYSETEHDGSAAAIELVALISGSKTVIPNEGKPGAYDIRKQPAIDEIQAAAVAAGDAASMWRMFVTIDDDHSAAGLSLQLAIREAHMRSSSYPHMVRETVGELLADPGVERDLRAAAGFGSAELLSVVDGLAKHRDKGWNKRFEVLRDFRTTQQLWGQLVPPDAASLAERALKETWANPSKISVVDARVLAETIGIDVEIVDRILDFFTCDLAMREAAELAEQFFKGDNPFRTRPFLKHPSGRRFLINDALLLTAVLERIEESLKFENLFSAYSDHRGATAEGAALRLLGSIFPTSSITAAFKYFVPDPSRPQELRPADYTKLVEGDGLLLVDDVAIVVEVKAGALSDVARKGNATRLRRDLSALITEGASQAARTRERIVLDRVLRLEGGGAIDLSGVREVHSIVVTLEDLAGVATVTDDLVSANLLPKNLLPLTISLHDLRIISELVERPAEFLLYLRRRTLPELTRRFIAPDELDLFMHMLNRGLYVEPDPDVLAAEVPYRVATTALRRRFKTQRAEFLTSRTVPLDDWYFYQLGERSTPAPKPTLNADSTLLALVDEIVIEGAPGWLSTATTLLSGDTKTQRSWARYGSQLAAATRQDGLPHMMTAVVGDRAQSMTVLAWVSAPIGLGSSERTAFDAYYRRYLAAKKHQLKVQRAALLVFESNASYSGLLFDNRLPGPDLELDAEVERFGLVPPGRMMATQASVRLKKISQAGPGV